MNETTRSPTQDKVAADFDRFSRDYEATINSAIAFGGSDHQFYIDVKRDLIVELTERALGDVGALTALDLGCGVGAYHPSLESRFAALHGADVSQDSVSIAATRHRNVTYAVYDGTRTPYPDDFFDVVFCVCVMHHVPVRQWEGFVSEMARILRPGGLALVFEHNPYNPLTRHIVNNCEIDKDAVLLRPYVLRNLFKQAAFDSINTRAILTVPPKTSVLKKIDRAMGFAMVGAQYYLEARKPPATSG